MLQIFLSGMADLFLNQVFSYNVCHIRLTREDTLPYGLLNKT